MEQTCIPGTFRAAALLTCILLPGLAGAGDWPRFQGPACDGQSPETGLARGWPATGLREIWSVSVSPGFGGPSVAGGHVYVMDRDDASGDTVRCLDLDTGVLVWSRSYSAPGNMPYPGSRSTPTVDLPHVYALGPLGHLTCLDHATGEIVWQRQLADGEAFDADVPEWGFSQSPVVWDGLVVVAPQGREATLAGFHRLTGAIVWQSRVLRGGPSYVSPIPVTLDGIPRVVFVTAQQAKNMRRRPRPGGPPRDLPVPPPIPGSVCGVDLGSGKVLWSYSGLQCKIPIAAPTPLPGNRLLLTGGYGAGSVVVELTRTGGAFHVSEVARCESHGAQIHQGIHFEGRLFLLANGNERRDGLVCLGQDGTIHWRTSEIPGAPLFGRGAIIGCDGMLYVMDGDSGCLHLVDARASTYRELSRATVCQGGRAWAPMALSQGRLIVRGPSEMKCLDLMGIPRP